MITGYNTDVRYSELVLHVQTEDKGLANPFIESLIYVGGRVLAAKRLSYADLLGEGLGEKEIIALMDRQHRTMIAAIRGGKFDDKLASLRAEVIGSDATIRSPSAAVPASGAPSPAAAAAQTEGMERTLDQVILEYLTSEAEQEQLALLIEDSSELASGTSAAVTLLARSSRSGTAVPGTAVTVRMISTADEPRILAEGKTGYDGQLHIEFDIPRLERGTSALIISAVSDIGRAEVKQLL
jgi:hypothetical protein